MTMWGISELNEYAINTKLNLATVGDSTCAILKIPELNELDPISGKSITVINDSKDSLLVKLTTNELFRVTQFPGCCGAYTISGTSHFFLSETKFPLPLAIKAILFMSKTPVGIMMDYGSRTAILARSKSLDVHQVNLKLASRHNYDNIYGLRREGLRAVIIRADDLLDKYK